MRREMSTYYQKRSEEELAAHCGERPGKDWWFGEEYGVINDCLIRIIMRRFRLSTLAFRLLTKADQY